MNSLKAYDSGSSSGDSSDEDESPSQSKISEESTLHLKKPTVSSILPSTALVAAPVVQPNETMDDRRHLDPK